MIAIRTRRAFLLAAPVLYFAAIRPRLLGWGASRHERRQPLPGDDLVPARWQTTRGITISAPAEEVWPWLVQMGYGRGGWYSYDWLERLIGAGEFAEGGSARRVLPELQQLALGDTVALSPAGGLSVAVLEPARALVLYYRMNLLTAAPARDGDPAMLDWTWAFLLHPINEASCRLLARARAEYPPSLAIAFDAVPARARPLPDGAEDAAHDRAAGATPALSGDAPDDARARVRFGDQRHVMTRARLWWTVRTGRVAVIV